jgi:hypothetical protein
MKLLILGVLVMALLAAGSSRKWLGDPGGFWQLRDEARERAFEAREAAREQTREFRNAQREEWRARRDAARERRERIGNEIREEMRDFRRDWR